MKGASSNHLIRFADCDPMGHLYNAKYLEYFMNAREDQLRETYDLDVYQYAHETGNSWIVIKNQISYFREARLMEEVIIESHLFDLGSTKAKVEMLMLDKARTHIKSLLWVEFLHFNTPSKSVVPHDDKMELFFRPLLENVPENNFDDRSNLLRKLKPEQLYYD